MVLDGILLKNLDTKAAELSRCEVQHEILVIRSMCSIRAMLRKRIPKLSSYEVFTGGNSQSSHGLVLLWMKTTKQYFFSRMTLFALQEKEACAEAEVVRTANDTKMAGHRNYVENSFVQVP
jgi:hypothetical protein